MQRLTVELCTSQLSKYLVLGRNQLSLRRRNPFFFSNSADSDKSYCPFESNNLVLALLSILQGMVKVAKLVSMSSR